MARTTYRTVLEEAVVAAPIDAVWQVLTDPRAMVTVDNHPLDVVDSIGDPAQTGSTWVEVHGEECGGDRVPARVSISQPHSRYALQLRQRGIRMTIDRRLRAASAGATHVAVLTSFRPALAGRPGQRMLPWLLFAIGVLPRLSADQDESWFERLTSAARTEV